MHRRSGAWPLAVVLALATGITLLHLSDILRVAPGLADPGAARATIVRRFYDGVNEELRTGDAAPLAHVVADNVVEHDVAPGLLAGRAGLVQRLAWLRATFPRVRLEIVEVRGENELVVARVRVVGTMEGEFLGITVPASLAMWGPVDVFRLAAGQIVEHWGGSDDKALLQPLGAATLAAAPGTRRFVSLRRLGFAPGATATVDGVAGQRILYLERGSLSLTLAGDGQQAAVLRRASAVADAVGRVLIEPGRRVTLKQGDLVLVPTLQSVTIRNVAADASTALDMVRQEPTATADQGDRLHPTPTPPGLTVQYLAGRMAVETWDGSAALALGQAMLPPGAALGARPTSGLALVAVEAGHVRLNLSAGTAWIVERDGGATSLTPGADQAEATLDGAAADILPDAVATMSNVGNAPALVLILTLRPDLAGVANDAGTPTAS